MYVYSLDNINNKIQINAEKIKNLTEEIEEHKEKLENILIIESSGKNEIKVSPNAIFTLEKIYNLCGYTDVQENIVPYDIVNLTKEEIQEKYPEWTIRSFSEDQIIMYKIVNEKCDEHYVVKEKEGFLAIYIEGENGELTLSELTDISTEYLTDDDKKDLEVGIKIHGDETLEKLLEDYNS